jgi:hypothetical protein
MDYSNPSLAEIAWNSEIPQISQRINDLTETINDLLTIIQNNDSFKNIDITQELEKFKSQRIKEKREQKLAEQLTPEKEHELIMHFLKYG